MQILRKVILQGIPRRGVVLPDGKRLDIRGCGQMRIYGAVGETLNIPGVLLVPDLHVKVIAQNSFGDRGMQLRGVGHDIEVLQKDGKRVCQIGLDKASRLYHIRGTTRAHLNIGAIDTARSVHPTILWHERFVHQGMGRFQVSNRS